MLPSAYTVAVSGNESQRVSSHTSTMRGCCFIDSMKIRSSVRDRLKFVGKHDIIHNGFLYPHTICVEIQCILRKSEVNAVTKLNKNYLRIGFVISLLIVIASICERANTDSILRTTNGILLGLIRSSIYIGIFAAWRFSVRQRIVPKNTRKYLSAVA